MRGVVADELQRRASALVGGDKAKERLCVVAVCRSVGSPISFGLVVIASLAIKLSKLELETVNERGLSLRCCKAVGKCGGEDDRLAMVVVDEWVRELLSSRVRAVRPYQAFRDMRQDCALSTNPCESTCSVSLT